MDRGGTVNRMILRLELTGRMKTREKIHGCSERGHQVSWREGAKRVCRIWLYGVHYWLWPKKENLLLKMDLGEEGGMMYVSTA